MEIYEPFYSKPKAPLVVKAVETFREKSTGRTFYQRAVPDDSRPGNYYANLSNKIGMLKLLELRENARAALGGQFDIRAFHEVVLSNGAVPLNILDDIVNTWFADTRSKQVSLGAN